MSWEILQADCIEAMRQMDEASVDAIVTDPPAGIAFMSKAWDGDKGGRDAWITWLTEVMRECWRVAKPGAHALVWALPRTSHWTGMAIESAGWEIRDRIAHHFGSGFPKSHNLPNGFGTALKPATEDWWLARKPLVGTVAQNVTEHGTGALNIDGCRIGFQDEADERESKDKNQHADFGTEPGGNEVYGDYSMVERKNYNPPGRWPANVAISHLPECVAVGTRKVKGTAHYKPGSEQQYESQGLYGVEGHVGASPSNPDGTETITAWECAPGCPIAMLDEQSGERPSGTGNKNTANRPGIYEFGAVGAGNGDGIGGDSGGASRFFYCAKASRGERNAGLEGFEPMPNDFQRQSSGLNQDRPGREGRKPMTPKANGHPTVKPIDLMRWLVRLVTPPSGTVLDPFTGSGTTGCACVLEGFDFIGIEREPEYVEIAKARIAWWEQHRGREADEVLAESRRSEAIREVHESAGQLGLELG